MNRNYFLWIVGLALASLFLIFFAFLREVNSPITQLPVPPVQAPYPSYIAGVGVVEPSSGNILVGASPNRRVEKVLVTEGQEVKKGDILFVLEDKDLKANLKAQQLSNDAAKAKLQRLQSLPRSEDAISAQAALRSASVEIESAKKQVEMVQSLPDPRSVSQEEKNRRLFNLEQANAKWQQADADLKKIQAGAWKPDLEIAELEIQQSEASMQSIKADLNRTVVRSPIDGIVLQIKVHEGEYPPPDSLRTPAMILGKTEPLYLRVSINQLDIPRFHQNSPATAYLEGDGHTPFKLEFVRIEPYLVNKLNLTNEVTEKVDTKVLNIVYCIDHTKFPLIVGQQMDVFIATKEAHKP